MTESQDFKKKYSAKKKAKKVRYRLLTNNIPRNTAFFAEIERILREEDYLGRIKKGLNEILLTGDVNVKVDGSTTLHFVADAPHRLNILRLLLENGADPNIRDKDGRTPLHFAAESQTTAKTELLLEYGADPNIANNANQTPLHRAAWAPYGKVSEKIAELLLNHKADPNAKDNSGWSVLLYAVNIAKPNLIKMLIERGIDLNDPANRMAFHILASSNGDKVDASIKLLVENGANINVQDSDGNTPLHIAASRASSGADYFKIKNMLDYGANPFIENAKGELPYDISARSDVADLFAERMLAMLNNLLSNPEQLSTGHIGQILKHAPKLKKRYEDIDEKIIEIYKKSLSNPNILSQQDLLQLLTIALSNCDVNATKTFTKTLFSKF